MITWCINTYNNLNYLKLVIESIKRNRFYTDSPIIVYAENCTDGTFDWLETQSDIISVIEENEIPKGIGGGANEAISRVETEYFSLVHSDMYITKDYDRVLLDIVKEASKPTLASSWRVEPNLWNQDSRMGTIMVPLNEFGEYHHNFDSEYFDLWSTEFKSENDISFRKAEGVSFVMKKSDWDFIGGNDPLYAPSSWEDMDLFLRMVCAGYDFVETSKALVYHFGSRGANFMGDDLTKRSERQLFCEQKNAQKWMEKWKEPPMKDSNDFITPTPKQLELYNTVYKNEKY